MRRGDKQIAANELVDEDPRVMRFEGDVEGEGDGLIV